MTVGPRYVTEMIHQCRYTRIAIYPSFFFVPRHYRGIGYTGPARGYATHWWESTTGVRPEPQTAGLTPASGDSSARLWEQAAAAKCEAVRVRDMDFLVRPGACDRAVLAEVVEHDCYRLLEWSPLRPPQRILDLGANIGVFTAWAARCFPAARVVGYEPDPEQAAVAQRNTQTLGNAAIVAASAVRLGGNSLATILGDQGADRVDLLKIDCAGAEWSLLEEAGADSLGRVDALAMELYCNGLAGRTPERMAGHLRRFFREVRIDRARLPVSCLVFASVPTAPR
jgi:SAM-dependent methyltransferase